ncbi:unnamed protein product [Trifolium pratense]|uniref:Uncharacterized protein n=1 Tax=Trifolium pratense TaxID=57577 RepID=A0ACB0JQ03_TRIPR|nr:unnamed protein product [Trifolium pratense]
MLDWEEDADEYIRKNFPSDILQNMCLKTLYLKYNIGMAVNLSTFYSLNSVIPFAETSFPFREDSLS